MVGGIVIEVSEVKSDPGVLFVDCQDQKHSRAIFVERNEVSERIEIGDSVWWQGRKAMWTPAANHGKENAKCGVDFDIQIPRVGYSGVKHPDRVS